jgi:site-specific recombinase XerD
VVLGARGDVLGARGGVLGARGGVLGARLRARNLAPKTIRAYADSATQLLDHAAATADVDDLTKIGKPHIEAFLADLAARWKPATVSVRYGALQQLFPWLVDEDEIPTDPMQRMRRPTVPEEPVDVLDLDNPPRLLTCCSGKPSPTALHQQHGRTSCTMQDH